MMKLEVPHGRRPCRVVALRGRRRLVSVRRAVRGVRIRRVVVQIAIQHQQLTHPRRARVCIAGLQLPCHRRQPAARILLRQLHPVPVRRKRALVLVALRRHRHQHRAHVLGRDDLLRQELRQVVALLVDINAEVESLRIHAPVMLIVQIAHRRHGHRHVERRTILRGLYRSPPAPPSARSPAPH